MRRPRGSTSRGCGGRPSVGRRLGDQLSCAFLRLQGLLTQPLNRDDRGATAVEYSLIVTLIAVVIVAAVTTVGAKVATMFTTLANAL